MHRLSKYKHAPSIQWSLPSRSVAILNASIFPAAGISLLLHQPTLIRRIFRRDVSSSGFSMQNSRPPVSASRRYQAHGHFDLSPLQYASLSRVVHSLQYLILDSMYAMFNREHSSRRFESVDFVMRSAVQVADEQYSTKRVLR